MLEPLAQRFWKKVQKGEDDECWLWLGTKHPRGYGRIRPDDGPNCTLYAHRVSWEIHHGEPVPEGYSVHHLCETKGCVNPRHLHALPTRDHLRGHWSPSLRLGLERNR